MSLRGQLLLVSLLTLALPWGGCQYVREMEATLRLVLEDSLLANAAAVANSLAIRAELVADLRQSIAAGNEGSAVYAHPLPGPVSVDGFADDWSLPETAFLDLPGAARARYALGRDREFLYLFVRVEDNEVVYAGNGSGLSDQLAVVLVDSGGVPVRYRIETAAPGAVTAIRFRDDNSAGASEFEPRIRTQWQPTGDGYNVELRLPLDLVGPRLGLMLVDRDAAGDALLGGTVTWTNQGDNPRPVPGSLVIGNAQLDDAVASLHAAGTRVRVVDADGWVRADEGQLVPGRPGLRSPPQPGRARFLDRLYRKVLDPGLGGYPATQPGQHLGPEVRSALAGRPGVFWYRPGDAGPAVVSAAWSIPPPGHGAVVAEQTSDAILLLTNPALTRLLGFTAAVMSVALLGLLAYATWLSVRIRRLRDAAEAAVSPEGVITSSWPSSNAGDEIGDLSRSFADLLRQVRDYTEFLRSLAGKLSHELRTPLAVVSSSLENLDAQPLDASARVYTQRAREGTERLRGILAAINEATRLEQTIGQADIETFDLSALVAGAVGAYRDVYPGRRFELELPQTPCPFRGAPDLVAQMLDKLIDNAADFSPVDGWIRVSVQPADGRCILRVANQGPVLPDTMQGRLFDSMVSVRNRHSREAHLGFGLYIVKLVTEFHHGQVSAANLPGHDGVELRIELPMDTAGSRPDSA